MMGYSLATDGDLEYRREDLVRVWREFRGGPSGLFLKQGRDIIESGVMLRPPFVWTRTQPDPDRSRFYYGKSFIYPLAAAPFVRVFGTNGFLVLHALLLALVVWCSYLFLHARMSALASAALAGGFVMVSVVPVYFVWITPELFNFSLGLLAYFCWLYKEVETPERALPGMRWLFRPSSDVVAAILLGIDTFSKVPNALLFLPILVWLAWKRRWGTFLAAGVMFGLFAGGLFLANVAISGEWNYQGGVPPDVQLRVPLSDAQVDLRGRAADGARRSVDRHHFRSPGVLDQPLAQPGLRLRRPLLRPRRVFLPGGLRARRVPRRAAQASGLAVSRPRGRVGADRLLHHHHAVHVARRRRIGRQPLLHGRLRRVPVSSAAPVAHMARGPSLDRRRPLHGAAGPQPVRRLFSSGRVCQARSAALVAGGADAA